MTTIRAAMERAGFDPPRLGFTLRTAAAACLALLAAWLAGLEHPQWSAMTVWAASLPLRGHLLEKSLFRALGTVIGSVLGMGLLLASSGRPEVIVAGLALWIGLCVGAGNIVRGFASYGVMLAGYSAAMVTLLHSAQSADPLAVGIDRMLTVLLGLLVALVVGWIFAARDAGDDTAARVQALSRRILGDLVDRLAGTGRPDGDEHRRLLSEMAAIEDGLDQRATGSLRSRKAGRAIRGLLSAQVALLLWMRRGGAHAGNAPLIAAVREAADASGDAERERAALRRAAGVAGDPVLAEALSGLSAATAATDGGTQPVLALHRDWIGAGEAALRAVFVILAVGAAWLLTGWEGGPFMLLGAAIMTTVFSTFDNPALTLRQVLLGQTLGVVGALACRWLAWPLAGSEAGLVLSMMPFILAGGLLFGHRRGAGPLGFDYNMVVLLLLQPVWPLAGSLAHSLSVGLAVILGPASGLIAFLLIFPVSGARRLRTLVAMMVREIEAMAANPGASRRRVVWRARLYHRVLRLVRWADKTGTSRGEAVDGGFALLLAGSAVLHIDALLRKPSLTPQMERRLNATRERLRRLGSDPRRTARALAATAGRVAELPDGDVGLLREAAAELAARSAFIAQAGAARKAQAFPSPAATPL